MENHLSILRTSVRQLPIQVLQTALTSVPMNGVFQGGSCGGYSQLLPKYDFFQNETLFEPIKLSNSSEGDLNDFEKGFQASQVTQRSNSKVTASGSSSISS